MSFYNKLNLPADPILPGVKNRLWALKKPIYGTQHYDPKRYIQLDIINTLEKLGLPAKFLIHFGATDAESARSFLHTDICTHNQKWTKIPMAINWELTPGHTQFSWYDPGNQLPCYPPDPDWNQNNFLFQGIHYGARADFHAGVGHDVSNCQLLDTVSLERNTAYLVRTDVPHQIVYRSEVTTRMCISLRFELDAVSTWDQAVDLLQPLIIQ